MIDPIQRISTRKMHSPTVGHSNFFPNLKRNMFFHYKGDLTFVAKVRSEGAALMIAMNGRFGPHTTLTPLAEADGFVELYAACDLTTAGNPLCKVPAI